MTDADPDDVIRCRNCGTEFSGHASPLGVCPACLLKLGMSDPNWAPEGSPPVAAAPATTPVTVARRRRLPWRRTLLGLGVLLLLAFTVTRVTRSFVTRSGFSRPSGNVVRFSLTLPDEADLANGAQFAVAPDSQRIVVAMRGPDGRQRLWLRSLASTEWRELSQTDGATYPFWSPDSRQVGFFADKRLKRVDIGTNLTYVLADVSAGRGGAWSPDEFIVFATVAGPLMRVSAAGGTPQQMTGAEEPRRGRARLWPYFLPGDRIIYGVVEGPPGKKDGAAILMTALDRGETRTIVDGGQSPAFVAGFLLFARGAALVAQPFDPARGEVTGDLQIVRGAEEIGGTPASGAAFSASSDVLVYRMGHPRLHQLTWFDREGRQGFTAEEPGDFGDFSLAPDSQRLAVARRDPRDGSTNIWLLEPGRGTLSRLTIGQSSDSAPIWSPDGSRVAFASDRENSMNIYVTGANGGGKAAHLLSLPKPTRLIPTDWSRDGRHIVYSATSPRTGSDLWMLPVGDERKPVAIVQTPFNESDGRFSPDGRFIAYVSDESGRDEVYVQALPPSEGKWQISTGGGTLPRWRDDGRELLFVAVDGELVGVEIEGAGAAIRPGRTRPLFPLRGAEAYDVSRGAERIVVKSALRERGDNELQVVLNWTSELRR